MAVFATPSIPAYNYIDSYHLCFILRLVGINEKYLLYQKHYFGKMEYLILIYLSLYVCTILAFTDSLHELSCDKVTTYSRTGLGIGGYLPIGKTAVTSQIHHLGPTMEHTKQ